MIGCLTETTTCLVAKPLVSLKLATDSIKLIIYKPVPGNVLDIVLLAATDTGDPADMLSDGDILRADDKAGDLLSCARKVELVPAKCLP